jgi:hypothetical protein
MIEAAPFSPLMEYDDAFLYAITCTHNNKYDWRMPVAGDFSKKLTAKTRTLDQRRKIQFCPVRGSKDD